MNFFNFRIYGYAPEFDADCKVNYNHEKSVFPTNRVPRFPVDTYTVVPDEMKIPEEEISWITFGRLIHKVYDYTIENKHVSLLVLILKCYLTSMCKTYQKIRPYYLVN